MKALSANGARTDIRAKRLHAAIRATIRNRDWQRHLEEGDNPSMSRRRAATYLRLARRGRLAAVLTGCLKEPRNVFDYPLNWAVLVTLAGIAADEGPEKSLWLAFMKKLPGFGSHIASGAAREAIRVLAGASELSVADVDTIALQAFDMEDDLALETLARRGLTPSPAGIAAIDANFEAISDGILLQKARTRALLGRWKPAWVAAQTRQMLSASLPRAESSAHPFGL